jgi:hypothetical protein
MQGLIEDKITTDIGYFSHKRKFPLHISLSNFDEQTIPLAIKENAVFIVFWIYIFRYLSLIFNDKVEIKSKKYKDVSLKYIVFIAILCTPNGHKNAENQFGGGGGALPPCRAQPCTHWGPAVAPRPHANFSNFR